MNNEQGIMNDEVNIYNVLGERIYANSLPEFIPQKAGGGLGWVIDISNHPRGIYFVKLHSEDGMEVRKIIYR